MKEFFREIPYLTGSRLVLRKITQEDAEGLRALVSSEITCRYLPTFLYEKNMRISVMSSVTCMMNACRIH